jgi:hypothetical protein
LPNTGDIVFEPYYAQQVLLQDRSRLRVMNKMRQGGFTTAFSACEAVHAMLYTQAPEIIVLSKSQDEAINFLDKFYLAYESVKDKEPNYSPLTVTNTKNAQNERGGKIRVLTSSKQSGRSFSGTDIYFDEMAHTQYAKQIYEVEQVGELQLFLHRMIRVVSFMIYVRTMPTWAIAFISLNGGLYRFIIRTIRSL